MRLLVLAPYPLRTVPGQRYRFEQYLDTWEQAGIEVTIRSLLSDREMAGLYRAGGYLGKVAAVGLGFLRRLRHVAEARRYDAVYVYREAFPLGYPIFERALAALGVPYVMDFDDAIWLQNSTAANRFIAPLKFARKTAVVARHAALVTVGNDHLAAWARQHQANVMVIPTTIDTDDYASRAAAHPAPDDGSVRIGWSGSTTTVAHLGTIEDVLVAVQRDRGVRLRIIGEPNYRLPGADVEVLAWTEATEVEDLVPVDIGIMPLPDDEWARGKCGAKALQYMALGIPTIMSPVGVNTTIAEGGAALLASTKDEWRAAIDQLIDDVDLRREMGRRGRERVEERYSVHANAALYVEAVRSIARSEG